MAQPGEVRLVPLSDDRFGGLQVLAIDGDTAQVALLDTIWDCRPTPADVRAAGATVQLRIPRARLDEGEAVGQAPSPPLAQVARVDAPLTALIAGLIATAI